MIRALTIHDLDVYRGIRVRALENAPDAFGETLAAFRARPEADLRAWFEEQIAWPERCIFVDERAGKARGMCGLYVRAAEPPAGSFWGLFVAPEARRRGVAAALLRRVVTHFAAHGVEHVRARVAAPNEEALRLYLTMGFEVGEVMGVLRDGSHVPVRGVEARVGLRRLRSSDVRALSVAFAAIGWTKPPALFERYMSEDASGERWCRVVEWNGSPAGYVTVCWTSPDPVLRERGIPEVMDLNVLPAFRGRGLGAALLAAAEKVIAGRSEVAGLRVGLHGGYGAAQRLYADAGYRPDGSGAAVDGRTVPEGATIRLDDDLTLRMTKDLGAARRGSGP